MATLLDQLDALVDSVLVIVQPQQPDSAQRVLAKIGEFDALSSAIVGTCEPREIEAGAQSGVVTPLARIIEPIFVCARMYAQYTPDNPVSWLHIKRMIAGTKHYVCREIGAKNEDIAVGNLYLGRLEDYIQLLLRALMSNGQSIAMLHRQNGHLAMRLAHLEASQAPENPPSQSGGTPNFIPAGLLESREPSTDALATASSSPALRPSPIQGTRTYAASVSTVVPKASSLRSVVMGESEAQEIGKFLRELYLKLIAYPCGRLVNYDRIATIYKKDSARFGEIAARLDAVKSKDALSEFIATLV